MTWTTRAWHAIAPIYDKILNMPFIYELQNGTLPLEIFQFYMLQDAKYLEHFGRVLAYLGSKSSDNEVAHLYFQFGQNALLVEKALHEHYFEQFGISTTSATITQPVCHHYVHFLKSTAAFEATEVGFAATLPCFWIYKEVGDHIFQNRITGENPYHAWINTYSSAEFGDDVSRAKAHVNKMAADGTEAIRKKMLDAFVTASLLEYQFWEAAYLQKTW